MRRFMQGAFAGGVGAAVVMAAGVAMAGTGVGGVFNLGQSNSVNATSTLTGATAAPSLQVTNTSTGTGATGIGVTVPLSKPPLKVNSATRVANLNADYVDGYGSAGFVRTGQSSDVTAFTVISLSSRREVTISAPHPGLVMLQGTLYMESHDTGCAPCYGQARLSEPAASLVSPVTVQRIDAGSHSDNQTVSLGYTFPAKAGTHTYSLDVGSNSGALAFQNPTLSALYVAFGPTGQPPRFETAAAAPVAPRRGSTRQDGTFTAR
jgi:hypothetical protein